MLSLSGTVTSGSLAPPRDLIAGIEVEQRLVEDRIGRAGLRRRRERAGRGVAIRHVDAEAEVLLDLGEEAARSADAAAAPAR